MLGSRSVVIFVNDTIPKMMTNMTATMTVYGFFTLNFEIIFYLSHISLLIFIFLLITILKTKVI